MRSAQGSPHDWSDPALLGHVARGIGGGAHGVQASDTVAARGRTVTALFGALCVLLLWRLLRESLESTAALVGAAAVAATPLLVLPAHYFAPDTVSLTLGLGALFCLSRAIQTASTGWFVGLGTLIGGAASTHYGGALLLGLCAAAPLAIPVGDLRSYGRALMSTGAVAGLVFAVINFELVLDPAHVANGPWVQLRRFFLGDHLYLPVTATSGVFHLVNTLRPGLTAPVLVAGVAGGVASLRQWRDLPPSGQLLLLYAGLAFALAELSPLKPSPGSERYMLPLLPAIGLGVGFALEKIEGSLLQRSRHWLIPVLIVLTLGAPLWASIQMIQALGDDTRRRAETWIEANAGRTLRGLHASVRPPDFASVAAVDLDAARRAGVTHVATSSFVYDTFARGSRHARQQDYVYDRHERYQQLFEYPYEEFAPDAPGFGWSQPTVRVLDIRAPRPPGRP